MPHFITHKMDKKIKLIYLLFILTLNFSCVEKKSTEKVAIKSEIVATSKTDTLKFTSAIRAIFQDSKGNYWIGSHTEGVSLYNGKSFEYFTTKEGLSDNQIRSIQEDKDGKIWLGTPKIINSAQGSQFTSKHWVETLKEKHVQISMDEKGRAIVNVYIERVFRTIKQDYIYLNPPNDGLELYEEIKKLMNKYNHRRHQEINREKPYEKYKNVA